jgi:hypothetical protein
VQLDLKSPNNNCYDHKLLKIYLHIRGYHGSPNIEPQASNRGIASKYKLGIGLKFAHIIASIAKLCWVIWGGRACHSGRITLSRDSRA